MLVEIPCSWCHETVKVDIPESQKEPPNVLCLECYDRLYKLGKAKKKYLKHEKSQRGFKTIRPSKWD